MSIGTGQIHLFLKRNDPLHHRNKRTNKQTKKKAASHSKRLIEIVFTWKASLFKAGILIVILSQFTVFVTKKTLSLLLNRTNRKKWIDYGIHNFHHKD